MDSFLQRVWYGNSPIAWLLWPLSWLFILVTALRRFAYRLGLIRSEAVSKPVIVVGNVTVGGTGKTPFVLWLAAELRVHGLVPGIITRGYGGNAGQWPQVVSASSDAEQVGDEAALLARRFGGIVVAGPDRVRSAMRAIELGATVVISDDGLQHYRLHRDIEVAVVDAVRRFGNGLRLPAGPLREAPARLKECDAIVLHRRGSDPVNISIGHRSEFKMSSRLGAVYSLKTGERRTLDSFSGSRVNAVAAIGNPHAFFAALRASGLDVRTRSFRDHAAIARSDLEFGDPAPILMTEKDAVKCAAIADERCWAVMLDVEVEDGAALLESLVRKLDTVPVSAHSAHSK